MVLASTLQALTSNEKFSLKTHFQLIVLNAPNLKLVSHSTQ